MLRALVVVLCASACLAVASRPAAAQEATDVADEAEAQFLLGNDAYRSSDFLKALSHYFASNRLARNRNVLFNIARCYEQLKRYVEAYRYYQLYADGTESPEERTAVEKALKRVAPNVALLRVASDPEGATLYLNRKDLGGYGSTPRVLAVAPGEYTVILERPGHKPKEQRGVELKVGEETSVKLSLERILGEVEVTGTPEGAQLRILDPSGTVVGVLPGTFKVSPGRHSMEVVQEGFVPQELTVEVEASKQTSVEVKLERQAGTVVVQSDEPDALILVDGRPVGFTPSVIDRIPAGRHVVTVQLSGFRPYTTEVTVAPDERVLVDARLVVSEEVEAASKTAESVVRAPASVSLISKREIEAFGFVNVNDALEGTRGYFSSDDGTYLSPGVRGYSPFGQYGNRVLVLMDGHTLNDDWIGSSYIGFDLLSDLHQLEQLEVVRGPVSALYGTGAFFGVVNLAMPEATPSEGTVRAGLSMVGEGTVGARVQGEAPLGEDGGIWLRAGGVLGQGRPFVSPAHVGSPEARDGRVESAGEFDAGSISGKVRLGELTLQGYFNQRDKQIPTGAFETILGDPRTRSVDRRAFVEVRGEHDFADSFSLFARTYYDHYGYKGNFAYADAETGVTEETYSGHSAGAEARATLRLWPGGRWALGSDVQRHFVNEAKGRYGDAAQTPYLDASHPYTQLSAYTLLTQEIGDVMTLSGALRFDGWWIAELPTSAGTTKDRFTNSISPRLALIIHPTEEDTIKLMGGRAFRAASIYELTYNDGGLTQVPSPGIDPETILTGEVEYARRFLTSYIATGSAFVNRLSNLIEQVGSGETDDPLIYTNQSAELWTLGAEAELRREFRQGWMMGLQYSWQRTRVGKLLEGDRIPNSPEHLVGGRLVVPVYSRALRLATRLVVDGGRLDRLIEETDAAVIWDLALSGEANLLGLRYSAGVRNLLDWRYDQPVGEDVRDVTLQQRGRYFVIDVSVAF